MVEKAIQVNIYHYITESNLIEGVYGQDETEQSLKAWNFLKDQDELSLFVILETHRIIMEKQWPMIAGRLRRENVQVGDYLAPHFLHVPEMMQQWVMDMEQALRPEFQNERDYSPMVMHINFEKIHPFRDGNGRIGRMLMWWHELKTGRTPTLIEYKNRNSYYDWF